ncbi:30S ribosomal protein S8e [Candidatus Woesearchaeota archaeon]|nr:MAG: 30S ribosomal protein S8e [Candidatus Woesearchaeota archaeon]
MALSQKKSKRSPTGAKYHAHRKKRKHELGRTPTLTRVSDSSKLKPERVRGGNVKVRILRADVANVFDPAKKKFLKAKVSAVVENPANRHYTRRNVITKGAMIETDKGKARVTSRPGQDGVINAVLVSE